jgi:GntR family transcriptional regulator/MocR family aminotransferase
MSTTTAGAALELALGEQSPGAALWQWLYEELRAAILEGRLKRGMRLPATRVLAMRYGISRGTVVTAFEQLHAEGYVDGKVGAGTYVSTRLPEDFLTAAQHGSPINGPRKAPRISRFARRLSPAPSSDVPPPRAFRPEPALDEFPIDVWTQISARCLRRATRTLLADSDSRGYRPLRAAIAEYLGGARGVVCTADQVVIVSGIQHGLDLTMRLLVDPGDTVCLEDPCHPIVSGMFKVLPARIVAVPVDSQGFDICAAQRACRQPRLIYTTPAHQFPLGYTMSVNRRLALLDWACRAGAWVFEDDYDSEYRYEGRPFPALQGFDRGRSVIFCGSFSKVLLPSLRLGYLVVPPELVDKFSAARFMTDRHSSVLDQAAMCDFLREGHFGRHIRRMREMYASRLAALDDALTNKLEGLVELPKTEAGILTVAWLKHGLQANRTAQVAATHHVETIPLGRFVLKTPRPEALVLGFAPYDGNQIREAVERLARAVAACTEEPQSVATAR